MIPDSTLEDIHESHAAQSVPEGEETIIPCTAAAKWFAITADYWTSCANEAYIDVTFHTITYEWELCS